MIESNLGPAPLTSAGAEAVSEAKEQPLGVPATGDLAAAEADRVHGASVDASTSAFHLGILIGGVLMIIGGAVAGLGIENPKRRVAAVATRGAAAAGECGHDADCGKRQQGTGRRRSARTRPCIESSRVSQIVFSGIQPTGRKHLGNYIGAIRQYVEGQDRGDPAIYCIVDLHAISVEFDPAELRERLYDTTAILLAAGLDPERCILFRQSDVREHTELTWLLSAVTAHGDLNRMHQFKEKSASQRELSSAALFFYPVLMAADVLAYRATEVPVGDDQRQHVELMREIARRFNERFGETLVVPELLIPEVGARIMDLQEPERKMSTTVGTEAGTVYVLDEPDAIRKKLGSAVTDSGREVVRAPDKPGVTNLIDILAVARGVGPEAIEAEFDGAGYGDFKKAVAEGVVDLLAPVQERYAELRPDEAALDSILAERRRAGAGDRRAGRRRGPRPDGHRAAALS